MEDVTPLTVSTADKPFPVVDDAVGETMRAEIAAAKAEDDSVGGIVECAVLGLPVGLGGPLFDGMEGRISSIVFGIPAVKASSSASASGPHGSVAAKIMTPLWWKTARSEP